MTDINKMDRLSFLAEWFDIEASIIRKFIFFFYQSDSTVEMFDIRNHRLFLKRTHCGELTLKDIFVGNTLKIFGRQIKIFDYADVITQKKMEKSMERTFVMIKPDGITNKGDIFCYLIKCGCQISQLKMTKLSKEHATSLYSDHQGKSFFPYLIDHVTSGPVIGMEILMEDSVKKLLDVVGPTDPTEGKSTNPQCIRARFGQDITRNVIHAAKSADKAKKESALFFEKSSGDFNSLKPVAQFRNSTCCIIKPHAVQKGLTGDIISMLESNGYLVTGLQLYYLDEINAEEFFEVYKGVVPEYMSMIKQLSSGPCIAMEVTSAQSNIDVPVEFRKFVGPADPKIAERIRPNTVRAIYGTTKIENAVHVTDLPEDAPLEVEYFFKILCS